MVHVPTVETAVTARTAQVVPVRALATIRSLPPRACPAEAHRAVPRQAWLVPAPGQVPAVPAPRLVPAVPVRQLVPVVPVRALRVRVAPAPLPA
ncbi:MAG: hypothetical protein JWO93_854 [Micrococcaceae bacterium]|nr:hypothetical protein [Micrococcaceae bacterium]